MTTTSDIPSDRVGPESFDTNATTELPILSPPPPEPRKGVLARLRARVRSRLARAGAAVASFARRIGRTTVRVARSRRTWFIAGATAGGLLLGFGVRGLGPQLAVEGPADGAVIGPLDVPKLEFKVTASNRQLLSSAVLTLNGGDVTDAARSSALERIAEQDEAPEAAASSGTQLASGDLLFAPTDLPDGRYVVSLRVNQPLVPWPERREWRFTLDRRPPEVTITGGVTGNSRGRAVRITGRVDERARVLVDEQEIPVDEAGGFTVELTGPPVKDLAVRAIDPGGNSTTIAVPVGVVPRKARKPVRAAHVTAVAWKSQTIREAIFRRIQSGALTTVQLDLKDERGEVGYTSDVPFARQIGANRSHYDLAEAVTEIHRRGGTVVGRLVAFRDPTLVSYALRTGRRSMFVQRPDGSPYSTSEGFTNPANPVVRKYNVDLAEEAAKAGVDEILYDYVRRPDGPRAAMRFPGLRDDPSDEVIRFLATTQKRLRPYGTLLGASIFGIAAGRRGPSEIAQDVPRMARYLDVVAPMLYPAGWAKGEYEVADPEAEPATIVRRSLRQFQKDTEGSGSRLVPWIQDYSKRIPYGPTEVRLQIDAARGLGIEEFLLWNPDVEYNFDGIPMPGSAIMPSALAPDENAPSTAPPIDDPLATGEEPTSIDPADPADPLTNP